MSVTPLSDYDVVGGGGGGVTFPITVPQGGTNNTSYTNKSVPYYDSGSAAFLDDNANLSYNSATHALSATVTALKSATTSVDVSAATAPSAGQALVATSGTAATWQNVSAASKATSQSTPADPATTGSTTGVMMGLAGSITPSATGSILICINGDCDNSISNDGCAMQIRYGTGSAPANGAALTGTAVGSTVKVVGLNANIRTVWALNAIVTGLTVSTAYWVDISLAAVTGGTARTRDIDISIAEVG